MTSTIYELYANGNTREFLQARVIDRNFSEKIGAGDWKRYPRVPIHSTIDALTGHPILTSCQYKGVETIIGQPALRYAATWRRNGWEASLDAWVSTVSGMIVRTVSHYKPGKAEFSFPVALQTMDYERAHAVEPGSVGH